MSSIHHIGEFTLQVFLYIARLIAEQRYTEVLKLGIRRDQAEKIRRMTTEDLHAASLGIRGNLLGIRLDPKALDAAFSMLERRKRDEHLDEALLQAGARYEMMHALCGMTTEEYARRRRYLGLTNLGRPEIPSDEDQAMIWKLWMRLEGEPCIKRRYLAIHEQTGVPAGTIWKLVSEWEATDFGQSSESHSKSANPNHRQSTRMEGRNE